MKKGESNFNFMIGVALSIIAFLIVYGIYIYAYKGADLAIQKQIMDRIL